MATSPETEKLFRFNPEKTCEELLKVGILNTFFHFKDLDICPTADIREDVSKALQSLAAIRIPTATKLRPAGKSKVKSKARPKTNPSSTTDKALVGFNKEGDDDAASAEEAATSKSKKSVALTNNERSEQFKVEVAVWIIESLEAVPNPVVETILEGTYSTLHLSEDIAGPFVDLFGQHIELFKKLATIYEKADLEALGREKGCYSHGLAVEVGLRAIEVA